MIKEFRNESTPVDHSIVKGIIENSGIPSLGDATIRDIVKLANKIEQTTGTPFVRMELGVPGLQPSSIAKNAEIDALESGVAAKYPMLEGVKPLKDEAARFIKLFMDIDLTPECCFPTVGSMQGAYAIFMMLGNIDPVKNTILFIDPGFPAQKLQIDVLGQRYESFDIGEFRGNNLKAKLEEYVSQGHIAGIIYSNPNNPTWMCLTDDELKIIGDISNQYNVVIIEDLAYFAMDFRKDLSKPGIPPFQPTIAKYTDNYVFLISSSKAFSYAGQRVGLLAVSPVLLNREYPQLKERFGSENFNYVLIYRLFNAFSLGASHSCQYGFAAMLKAANEGKYNFLESVREYERRAVIVKEIFQSAGFNIVYDMDLDEKLGDGFYFTVAYPGMSGSELVERLLYYGISAISLSETGSEREGMRVCMSQIGEDKIEPLKTRLLRFSIDYK